METKTEQVAAIQGTPSNGRSSLALVEPRPVQVFEPIRWGPEDLELIKKQVCPAGIPDGEFKLFIAKCQASGMNPLLGEAFCVKRKLNAGTKDSPRWVDTFSFTPGEQGMEARADKFPDYGGLRAAVVHEKDQIVIDPSSGEVAHTYLPNVDRGRLVGAWAIAYRDGRKTPVEYVRLDEYADGRNPQWSLRPETMIVKCARAAALRRTYPNAFAGVYVGEEMKDESPSEAQLEQAGKPTTVTLSERLAAQAEAARAVTKETKEAPAATITVDARPEPKLVPAPAMMLTDDEVQTMNNARKPAPTIEGPVMVFGPLKGAVISTLTGPQLLEMVALGESNIGKVKNKVQAENVRACIIALSAERHAREKALLEDKLQAAKPGYVSGDDGEAF